MYLVDPEDSYWKVGMIALGQWNINSNGLKNHFLGWAVKAFFLPLMYIPLCDNIGFIQTSVLLNEVTSSVFLNTRAFTGFYDYLINMIFTLDLLVIFIGYILTIRVLDSHIRSVEPSFLGWYVALQCYKPFWNAMAGGYFSYDSDGYFWKDWLFLQHKLYVVWGCAIIFLLMIYTWASLSFGLRFSNLTHRGIITNGPYRYMRHPAYVCKNLSWWLISIPFIPQMGMIDALKSCIMLLILNFIYFLRAKTEERHLSQDPVYVQYASVINEIGIFRWLMKRVSFLRYDETKVYKIGSLSWMR
jgi:protein-S-isoprenylcysteine O-methyltransferase Ste14